MFSIGGMEGQLKVNCFFMMVKIATVCLVWIKSLLRCFVSVAEISSLMSNSNAWILVLSPCVLAKILDIGSSVAIFTQVLKTSHRLYV